MPYQSKNRDTDRHTNGDANRVIGRDYHWGNTDEGDTPHGPPVTRTPTDTPTETLIDTPTENAGDDKDLFAPFRTFRRACSTVYCTCLLVAFVDLLLLGFAEHAKNLIRILCSKCGTPTNVRTDTPIGTPIDTAIGIPTDSDGVSEPNADSHQEG